MKVFFEIRRKAIHITLGMAFCFLIYFDLFFPLFWLGVLVFSVFFSFLLKKHRNSLFSPKTNIPPFAAGMERRSDEVGTLAETNLPEGIPSPKGRGSLSVPKILNNGKKVGAGKKLWWETWLLSFIFSFEREEEMKKFPLQGAVTFLLGCILSFVLFPKLIAISAIIVLFVGDSAACFYGIYFGKIKIPWSFKKHLDAALNIENGTFPFWKGFLASILALIFESLKFGQKNISIDDNVLIPLISGFILYLII